LAGETEALGENLPQRHFIHHKIPHDQTRSRIPDRSGGKTATNCLSYGAALAVHRATISRFKIRQCATRFGLLDHHQVGNCCTFRVTAVGVLVFTVFLEEVKISVMCNDKLLVFCFRGIPLSCMGHAVVYLVEALCYKPEGRGFHFR
jgi:hypothetical protein